jgi:hypothetical protein
VRLHILQHLSASCCSAISGIIQDVGGESQGPATCIVIVSSIAKSLTLKLRRYTVTFQVVNFSIIVTG